ncbi:MAG: ankyrin repeat domain-containing protein [Pirellulales bacterium]
MPSFLPFRMDWESLIEVARQRFVAAQKTSASITLDQIQHELAREYGFRDWSAVCEQVTMVRAPILKTLGASMEAAASASPVSTDDATLALVLKWTREGNVTEVMKALAVRPELARAAGPQGFAPLHAAAEANDSRLAVLFLAYGADPLTKIGETGHDALSWAVTCLGLDCAKTLVRLGTPLDLYTAAGGGWIDSLRGFFDSEGRLCDAAVRTGSSRFDAAGQRLPCPPPTPTERISDALAVAARNGQAKVVEFLLSKSPDLSFRAFSGATALHWAYFSGDRATIELLLKAGASTQVRDEWLAAKPEWFGVCTAASWGLLFKVRSLVEAETETVGRPANVRQPTTSPRWRNF